MLRRKPAVLVAAAMMLTAMLVGAAPALADTSSVGNLFAGTVAGGAVVAGSENLTDITGPPNLPIGSDTAFAGNRVPPNPVAAGINLTFESNLAIGGVGPARNDVVAESDFFGGDFTHTRIGNLSADTQ